MVKTGPKTKPTRLKVLEGNPGKRTLPVNEPMPDLVIPDCPAFLRGAARREWKRITTELYKLGLLTRIDRAALAGYCQSYGRWEEAERLIASGKGLKTVTGGKKKNSDEKSDDDYSGWLFMTSNGNVIMSPVLSIANKAMEQMHKFITEFGMTPASRARMAGGGDAGKNAPKSSMQKLMEANRELSN